MYPSNFKHVLSESYNKLYYTCDNNAGSSQNETGGFVMISCLSDGTFYKVGLIRCLGVLRMPENFLNCGIDFLR